MSTQTNTTGASSDTDNTAKTARAKRRMDAGTILFTSAAIGVVSSASLVVGYYIGARVSIGVIAKVFGPVVVPTVQAVTGA